MYETTYHRPSSIDEAAALFAKGKEAKYLAGGHTLIPVMKQRLAAPSDVIDLVGIKDLVGVEVSARYADHQGRDDRITTWPVSGAAQKAIPALAHLASVIGDPAVRHRGTIGGSIANNDPAADYPAAVLALGATVKTNKRSIAADDFFKGLFATALADGEIITQVAFPIPAKAGYSEVAASGLALRADRRIRRQDEIRRRPRRRHRRISERRHAGTGDRGGAEGELVGRRARQHQDFRERIAERYPRLGGLSRQSDQGDGTARGDRRGLTAPKHTIHASGAQRERAALFLVIFSAKGACYIDPKTRQFRRETLRE